MNTTAFKIFGYIILVGLFLTKLIGCSSDPVQSELIDYINKDVPKFATLETEMVEAYEAVSAKNYKDDPTMFKALDEVVVPKCEKILSILEKDISPKTTEIKELHQIYIDAYKDLLSGYTLAKTTTQKSDANLVEQANKKFKTGRELQQQWLARLNELKKEYNVVTE